MTMLLLNVFGGLAIFIYGMKMMSEGLHSVAGEKMRSVLRLFSANRFVAICSGAAVTAVIQSSGASTVMVIGFINAGLLNLVQAMGIIFGANIGTTITAQLVAFNISWIIMPTIIIGLIMTFIPRHPYPGWGNAIMGLGLLFFGMVIMSGDSTLGLKGLKDLAGNDSFRSIFNYFDCAPVNGLIPLGSLFGAIGAGMVATMLLQSSSACSGIIIALGASGLLDVYTAVALVLGSNIGTTVTAQLVALSANRLAKQAAWAHTFFNVLGVLIMIVTFYITWNGMPIFFRIIEKLSPQNDLPRQIANAHTLFNVATTLILTPFVPLLAKLCERIVPVRADRVRYKRLEPILLDTPAVALVQTSEALRKMLKKSWRMVNCALKLYDQTDKMNLMLSSKLDEWEEEVDSRQKEISNYLSELMQRRVTPLQAEQIPLLLHCTNDAERIGDHTADIRTIIQTIIKGDQPLSESADAELKSLHKVLTQQAQAAISLLKGIGNVTHADADHLRSEILKLTEEYETAHLHRLARKECSPVAGVLFLELVEEIRKVSRHLSNIAERADSFYKKAVVAGHGSQQTIIPSQRPSVAG